MFSHHWGVIPAHQSIHHFPCCEQPQHHHHQQAVNSSVSTHAIFQIMSMYTTTSTQLMPNTYPQAVLTTAKNNNQAVSPPNSSNQASPSITPQTVVERFNEETMPPLQFPDWPYSIFQNIKYVLNVSLTILLDIAQDTPRVQRPLSRTHLARLYRSALKVCVGGLVCYIPIIWSN
jgi:hypothetical protein